MYVTTDPGHTCSDPWYERGSKLLLDAALAENP